MLDSKRVARDEANALLSALETDPSEAKLSPAERAMLDYVVRLTDTPGAITRGDIDELRTHGFDDIGIHDICVIASYFAFVNRIADGLGVELE